MADQFLADAERHFPLCVLVAGARRQHGVEEPLSLESVVREASAVADPLLVHVLRDVTARESHDVTFEELLVGLEFVPR